MEFHCGQCGHAGSADDVHAGYQVKCASCDTPVVLPQPSAEPPRIARPTATVQTLALPPRPIWIQCKQCDSLLQTNAMGGQSDRCPSCSKTFVVPMTPQEKAYADSEAAWARRAADMRTTILQQQARREQERLAAEARRQAQQQRLAEQRAREEAAGRMLQQAREDLRREVARDCGSLAISEGVAFDNPRMDDLCRRGSELLASVRQAESDIPRLQQEIPTIDADLERGRLATAKERLRQLQTDAPAHREALKTAQMELGLLIADQRLMPEMFGLFLKRLDMDFRVDDDGQLIALPAPE